MPESSGEKSFDPTPHRRQQAREQGQVAFSQDLGSAALLLVGSVLLLNWGGAIVDVATRYMEHQLGSAQTESYDSSDASVLAQSILRNFGGPLLPILGLLMLAGVLSTVLQIGLLFLPEKLQLDASRVSLFSGVKRILSLQGAARLGFGMIKILIVAVVAGTVLYRRRHEVLGAADLDVGDLGQFLDRHGTGVVEVLRQHDLVELRQEAA
jgi:flagellar biosynthetic protein FlhB